MTNYVYSTKIWSVHDGGTVPSTLPGLFVIGRTLAEAATRAAKGAQHIEFAGVLLITKADMHVIFDPPPPVDVPAEPSPVVKVGDVQPVTTGQIGTGGLSLEAAISTLGSTDKSDSH